MDKHDVDKIIPWIKDYVLNNAHAEGVVIGISGGKDSLITAKLCAEALGEDRVLGIIMPNGSMKDLSIAIESCKVLNIRYYVVDINNLYTQMLDNISPILDGVNAKLGSVTTINISPRLRTNTLYAIAGSLNYLVANTSNLSESMIGYTTKWGDNIGDFGVLCNLTKTEVCEIGDLLGLPHHLVHKVPDDGLSGQSDEEKLGFSYDELDNYIRNGIKGPNFDLINRKHITSNHKRVGVIKYDPIIKNYFE